MTLSSLKQLIREDLFRYDGELSRSAFYRTCRYEAGFRISCLTRLCKFLRCRPIARYAVYPIFAFCHSRTCIRYGVYISPATEVGGGLYIPHALNIVINSACVIGANCNLSQGVTLGVANRGKRAGVPVIGNRVYIGPGAVVFGSIKVGDKAAIGANCVVTKDVPENGVVVGVPGRVISDKGSEGYVNLVLENEDS